MRDTNWKITLKSSSARHISLNSLELTEEELAFSYDARLSLNIIDICDTKSCDYAGLDSIQAPLSLNIHRRL